MIDALNDLTFWGILVIVFLWGFFILGLVGIAFTSLKVLRSLGVSRMLNEESLVKRSQQRPIHYVCMCGRQAIIAPHVPQPTPAEQN